MVVRSEDIGFLSPDKDLPESAGAMDALKAKGNFQQCPHFFSDPIDIRRDLHARRNRSGADTADGHTCSNIVEILDTWLTYQRPAWATHPTQTLAWRMNWQIERLAMSKGDRA